MEGAAVGSGECEMHAQLRDVVEAGGASGGGIRALQRLRCCGRGRPLVATALVDDQIGLWHGGEVTAAIPGKQVVAIGAIAPDPVALRGLAIREVCCRGRRSHIGRSGVTRSVACQDPVEVGSRRVETCVGE